MTALKNHGMLSIGLYRLEYQRQMIPPPLWSDTKEYQGTSTTNDHQYHHLYGQVPRPLGRRRRHNRSLRDHQPTQRLQNAPNR